jgi:glycosyltransferase involved in cell wall biosynthesis
MIKILRVSTHPTNSNHGVGLHSFKISDINNLETTFVCPLISRNDEYKKSDNFTLIESNIFFSKRPIGVSVIGRIIFQVKRVVKITKFSWICVKYARENNVDIIHIHSPMYFLVAVWGKLTSKLTCITYHGTDYVRIKSSSTYQWLSTRIIDIGCCISRHMMSDMSDFHKKVYYTPNGIDSEVFVNQNVQRETSILAVGSLKREKCFDNLILAFKNVLKTHPGYKLKIAGDGPLREMLEDLTNCEGLNDNVTFLGNLDLEKLVMQYNHAEILILSSESEGFPKVVLEGIFCGCKVISTNVGSLNEFMPSKYLMKDNSINSLCRGMKNIIESDDYWMDIEALKSNYTWQKTIEKYIEIYENNI